MNTHQLLKCIRQEPVLSQQCQGVFPLDKISNLMHYPSCLIANLDDSSKPGSHWIAIYIDEEGRAEYFDSFGREPVPEIRKQLKKCDIFYNSVQVQSPWSSVCGQHSLYYLHQRARGSTMNAIVAEYSEDCDINDTFVVKWVNKCFDVDTDVFELDFVIEQFACALYGNK